MSRYRMEDKCVFVDAYQLDDLDCKNLNRDVYPKPDSKVPRDTSQDIKCAFVMDKRSKPHSYTTFNDAAAFIARFIVMGVDTSLIPDILKSEYDIKDLQELATQVQKVETMLKPFMKEIKGPPRRTYQQADYLRDGQEKYQHEHSGIVELNFRINQIGGGGWKLPH